MRQVGDPVMPDMPAFEFRYSFDFLWTFYKDWKADHTLTLTGNRLTDPDDFWEDIDRIATIETRREMELKAQLAQK